MAEWSFEIQYIVKKNFLTKVSLCGLCRLTSSIIDNSLPNNTILDQSKIKALADYKIIMTEKLKFVLRIVENI